MAKRTVWIIQEIDWQYNDEIYYRSDSGESGIPKIVYTTKAQADAACAKLNKDQLKHDPDMPIGYEEDENGNYPTATEFFEVVEVELGG